MKNNVYHCIPQFYYIKVGFKGVKIVWACFHDASDYSLCIHKHIVWVLFFCNQS